MFAKRHVAFYALAFVALCTCAKAERQMRQHFYGAPPTRTTQPHCHPLNAAVFRTLAIIAATAAEATRKLLQCN